MNKCKYILFLVLLFSMAIIMYSCDRDGGFNRESTTSIYQESETDMMLITSHELLQFIRDNDTGVTEDDFEGIDIDDFIEFCHFPAFSEREDTRLQNLTPHLDRYKDNIERELYNTSQFKAREIISINSTDEEYEAFIEEFLSEVSALGFEYDIFDGLTSDGLDSIDVYADGDRNAANRYYLFIGRTMDIHKYDVTEVAY